MAEGDIDRELWEAVGEVTERESAAALYRVGYRNPSGGGVRWPAGSSLDGAKLELARRKTEETTTPSGIVYWYIEEQRTITRTTVIQAEAP